MTADPGAHDQAAKTRHLSIRFGLGWAKSHSFHTGQTPVMGYNRQLMQAILYDKVQIAKAVNGAVITLDQAPTGYAEFDSGVAKKFVLNPHNLIPAYWPVWRIAPRTPAGPSRERPAGVRGVNYG